VDIPDETGQIILASTVSVLIENQNPTNDSFSILLGFSDNNIITNNNFSNSIYGIYMENSNNNEIHNNSITKNRFGIYSSDGESNIFENNVFSNNQFAIKISESYLNIIECNSISNNSDGIYVDYSDNNHILNNNIISSRSCGVIIRYSDNNNVKNNNVSDTSEGITLIGSHWNDIADNNIITSRYGIDIRISSNNTISNNRISLGYEGISLSSSRNNHFFNNLLIDTGISLYGESVEDWNTNIIDPSNKVYEEPILFMKDRENEIITGEAGWIILVNCKNIIIEDILTNGSSKAIIIGYSSNISIINNMDASLNNLSIEVFYSKDCMIQNNRLDKGISISDSININIHNNVFKSKYGYGINIASSNDCDIINNTINVSRTGIHFYKSENNSVINNNVSGNQQGISMSYSYNTTIENNTAINIEKTGISLSDCSGNFINNNIISINKTQWTSGISLSRTDNNFISNNIISNPEEGISLFECRYNSVINNTLIDCGFSITGDNIENWNTHIIDETNSVNGKPINYWKNREGGVISNNAGQVILAQCTGVTVENCDIRNSSSGIQLGYSSDCVLINNVLSNNSEVDISLFYSDNIILKDNIISSHIGIGIQILSCNETIMINNSFTYGSLPFILGEIMEHWSSHSIDPSNTVNNKPIYYWTNRNDDRVPPNAGVVILVNCTGIIVENQNISNVTTGLGLLFSSNNIIRNNTLYNNSLFGMALLESQKNIIYNNTLAYNEIGILVFSKNNFFTQNNFLFNTYQWPFLVDFYDSYTQLSADYPIGGNYWSDYNGFDNYSGLNQDILGSDGIGDNPYEVSYIYSDNYPLMNPVFNSTWTPPRHRIPSAPKSISADEGEGYVNLQWDAPTEDSGFKIIDYNIYRSTNTSLFKFFRSTTDTTFNDTNVSDDQTYYYRVSAENIMGEGPQSSTVNGTSYRSTTNMIKEVDPVLIIVIFAIVFGIMCIGFLVNYRTYKEKYKK
jgi:parallel beta-helix repeat protein